MWGIYLLFGGYMARHYMAVARRDQWIQEHGPCKECGSWDDLEVDHINRDKKAVQSTSHIWNWSDPVRREAELVKCQVLCHECHRNKTTTELEERVQHGTLHMYNSPKYKCRCPECKEAWSKYLHEYRESAGQLHPRVPKLSEEQIKEMRELYISTGVTQSALAKKYGVSIPTITKALYNR